MSVYTRKGDSGQTSIIHKNGLSKTDIRIAALAALDELNACLGLVKVSQSKEEAAETTEIQMRIMRISSLLAGSEGNSLHPSDTTWLESKIDVMEAAIPNQTGFVVPGESALSAQLHVARTICRRAEIAFVGAAAAYSADEESMRFLNRLSDYLYTLARYTDFVQIIHTAVLETLEQTAKPNVKALPKKLNLETAKRLLEAVEKKAAETGLNAVAAIVNAHGAPMAVHVMDGTFLISYDAAISKAYTAAALRMPTEALAPHLFPGGMFYGLESIGNGKITSIGGGIPLTIDGETLGAIGISGGTAEQDIALARLGVEIFNGS